MNKQPQEAVIRCEGIWKVFGGRAKQAIQSIKSGQLSKTDIRDKLDCVVGVRDASFSVGRGEIFCIMGLSGSGKSTLIRHINRLIEPTDGAVYIEGRNVNAMGPKELRQLRAEKIGMVFQNMALMPHRNVRDNVAFALEVRGVPEEKRREVARQAIETVELTGWDLKYPDELSGGMQQRVGLARAIAANPSILLMDEPFSALDPLIRRQLQGQFMQLSAELHKTTVFITHDLDEAIRIGDRIAIMRDGVLVQVGTPEEIVTQPADDYVADFVGGISKLDLVTAAKVMQPFEQYRQLNPGQETAAWPVAHPDDKLNTLVDLSIGTSHPTLVKADDAIVGVVTKDGLLRGIQGRQEIGSVQRRSH
ncbi:quaternary amine ABC transporter ATP-binding protein [Neorhizobium galegae]|uniref:Quaternary amine transport ATP-binding protein n=1 Tax=Neorhizobium galegae bv. orientalis str. HAMBI 540 TaxID=1028800 RepID=A0A068T0G1_NEOGA|nr:glycine betaine/L-proline ABC transporter ATP-binding protein [Neorhizobium galegae]MCQ1854568.1 glycine betaine/L-proline ABC transporter ATP-binding protein [Neorhizobium galegae]CDN51922.1 Putative glycine betaine/L-proline transport ATP-binding protein ProV [Neorhizobium galegae bv. orientalis str. HAMBI 540]CDZ51580.1 Glycine betaine/L-proline transport ATP binding subunit [Neorhizobium galegae bv. orientalis]